MLCCKIGHFDKNKYVACEHFNDLFVINIFATRQIRKLTTRPHYMIRRRNWPQLHFIQNFSSALNMRNFEDTWLLLWVLHRPPTAYGPTLIYMTFIFNLKVCIFMYCNVGQ